MTDREEDFAGIPRSSVRAAAPARAVSEGRKLDAGKRRFDLVPWQVLDLLADVLTFGAAKYAPDNWRKVPEWRERYYAALMRHLQAWRGGEWLDSESRLPHLGHALACLAFLVALDEESRG